MIPEFLITRYGPVIAKVIFWIGIAVLVCLVLTLAKCTLDRGQRTEIKLSKGQAGAATASGRDAVNTLGNQTVIEQASDKITKENENAVRNTSGANVPVADDTRDAGIAGLCRRAAYHSDPKCMQHSTSH